MVNMPNTTNTNNSYGVTWSDSIYNPVQGSWVIYPNYYFPPTFTPQQPMPPLQPPFTINIPPTPLHGITYPPFPVTAPAELPISQLGPKKKKKDYYLKGILSSVPLKGAPLEIVADWLQDHNCLEAAAYVRKVLKKKKKRGK